jgi:hypothetical protein
MKLQLNPSIATTEVTPVAAAIVKSPEASAVPGDGIQISSASAALNQLSARRNAKIDRVAAAVHGDSYQTSSPATSNALVEDALTGGN